MKRLLFILIPSLIFGIIVFLVFQVITRSQTARGALQVTSVPESKVYLDGTLLGQTPLCKCEDLSDMLKTGEYTIRLVPSNQDTPEFQERITITKSVLTVVDRKFESGASSEGSVISLSPLRGEEVELFITSFPDKAEVLLDNNLVGMTPLLLKDVTASDHTLNLKKSGYKEKSVRIKTAKGYKLFSHIYLGIDTSFISPTPTQISSPSASPSISPSPSTALSVSRVRILQTPNGFLRVRANATIASAEIARVLTGDTLVFLDEQSGWYKVKLTDGREGWISSQYAQKQ